MDFDGDGEVDSDEEVDITPTVATQEQVSHEIKARVPRDADVTVVRKTLYNNYARFAARSTDCCDGWCRRNNYGNPNHQGYGKHFPPTGFAWHE